MRKISILGSTGSIGTQTLEIVRANGDLEVVSLAAGSNITLLEQQIREFHPKYVAVWSEENANKLRLMVSDLNVTVLSGMEGLIEIVTLAEIDIVVTAIVGMIGIRPTIAAMKAGKDIALANKETLVTAGHIIMPLAKECKVNIYPVDSEHSAIFQCLATNDANWKGLNRILLTASGGPFRTLAKEDLEHVRVEDALKHPNWAMGQKITIDSATMVNKGLEVIEAKWLFGVDFAQVQVVVQPKSIIHSMIELKDGAVLAQLGTPDMKLPIQYALYYPERKFLAGERLDFWKLTEIAFERPDFDKFRGLALAYEAGRKGGNMTTILNAANEKAVAMFLNRKIGYLDIPRIIEASMGEIPFVENPSVEQILETEQLVYEYIAKNWKE